MEMYKEVNGKRLIFVGQIEEDEWDYIAPGSTSAICQSDENKDHWIEEEHAIVFLDWRKTNKGE